MSKNIEIKAGLKDKRGVLEKLKILADSHKPLLLNQIDEFYNVPFGRLKFRNINKINNELIFYVRANSNNVKSSKYIRIPTIFPNITQRILRKLLGTKGIIKKTRNVFFIDNIRIHIDDVYQLGAFIEIEYVVDEKHNMKSGYKTVTSLMKTLGIHQNELCHGAYLDIIKENEYKAVLEV